MKLLDYENPLMQALTKIGNLIWLNFLTILCCLPVVTAGAALSALHAQALKLVRQEESEMTAGYFHAFRENFRQGTICWLLLLSGYGIVAMDFWLVNRMGMGLLRPLLTVVLCLLVCVTLYVFPIQAKFSNRVFGTIKNALLMSLVQFPKTAVMAGLYLLSVGLTWMWADFLPIWLMFGLSVPTWLSAMLYNRLFLKLEQAEKVEEGQA